VGFKLTVNASEREKLQAIQKQFDGSNVDYVVHNDLVTIRNSNKHVYTLYGSDDKPTELGSVEELGQALHAQITTKPLRI
jgi:hypothetical protein